MEPKDRIIFAADVGSLDELKAYLAAFGNGIGAIKLGMELLTHALLTGEPIVKYVLEETNFRIMWDLKYGDIPDTVAGAAKEVAKYGQGRILGFTVHCMAGKKALERAVQAVKENFGEGPGAPMVIGITLLTSLDQSDLDKLKLQGTPKEVVLRFAEIAAEAGVPAIVCSPQETSDVLMIDDFTVINPGIRFQGSDLKSQKRVTTPEEAIRSGATYIVMGSDLRKGDPAVNARRAAAEILCAEYESLTKEQILETFGQARAIYDNSHFVYKAGGHGKAYVNKDDIYKDPDSLERLCTEMAFRARQLGAEAICGPTVGGVLVANYVAKALRRFTGNPNVVAIFADEDGDKRILKRGYGKEVAGKKVLIVEDVINSGKSAGQTCRATEEARGEIVGCYALCNRSSDKPAAAMLINVPNQKALLEIEMDNVPVNGCLYCASGVPINQELGHGRQFLAELAKTDPEKAARLGWRE
jgi:orotidine 5'-phosphate decarboxylase subfamily 1